MSNSNNVRASNNVGADVKVGPYQTWSSRLASGERLTAAGFRMLLRKPIDPWALSRAIATLAGQS